MCHSAWPPGNGESFDIDGSPDPRTQSLKDFDGSPDPRTQSLKDFDGSPGPLSHSKSQAIEALLKEVREKREAHRESRKRKRDVDSTAACPNGQTRSVIATCAGTDTEAADPKFRRKDVTAVDDNAEFIAAHVKSLQ